MNLKLKMQKEHQMKNPGMELELNELESVFGGNGTDPSFEKPSKW